MTTALTPIPRSLGIDFGEHSLKIVELDVRAWPPWDPPVRLRSWSALPFQEKLWENGAITNPATAAELIKRALAGASPAPPRLARAVASIPDTFCFIKSATIALPATPAEIATAVTKTAAEDLPLSLDDARFEYTITRRTRSDALTMYGAVARDSAESLQAAIERAGLVLYSMEPEALSLARSVEHLVPPHEVQIIVDLGASSTSLVVAHREVILFTTTLPIGGNDITARIAQGLKISPEKAEELKRQCGLDPARCEVRLRGIVDDVLTELITEIRKGITFVKRELGKAGVIHSVALVGGGANIARLDHILSRALFLKVRRIDPTSDLERPADLPALAGPMLATALGLARLSLPHQSHRFRLPSVFSASS